MDCSGGPLARPRRKRRASAPILAGMLTVLSMAIAAPASALRSGAGIPGPKLESHARGGGSRISLTPSASRPYYACPGGACEAIIDPKPLRGPAGYALPGGGPLLEGGGEKGGYDPQDLQSAYKIPVSGGATQTVALVDAFGYAAAEADLAKYRSRYGLEPCTKAAGCFRRVNEHGEEANYPPEEVESGWQAETALDLDMASAACPHCHILLVEASTELPADTGASVNTAAALGATEISNSYGYPEEYEPWCGKTGCAEYSKDYDHAGVVVTASAGDSGYDDHYQSLASPDFPATSPYVVAVGGTALRRAANSRGWSEEVWNEPEREIGTGSGCSKFESKPSWQSDAGCAKRTDNDVAADAACKTAVSVYSTYFGGWEDLCGTSASSPLLAGIIAHESEATRLLGAYAFYQEPGSLADVTAGSNGECTPAYLCTAEVGYDGPTGLGTPQGSALPATITKIEPSEGPAGGGTSVTITGSNLSGATAVSFGSTAAASFSVKSPSTITAVSPSGTGTVNVTVTTAEGTSAISSADEFNYTGTPPEFGRCEKVTAGTGKYSSSACDALKVGGSYEWMPGAVKAGFTSKGATSKLTGAGGIKIECKTEAGKGDYQHTRGVASVLITFTGCEIPGLEVCSSAGAGAGELVTNQLEGALEWESKAAKKLALDLFPADRGGLLMKFECGPIPVEVRGSVLAPVKADKMALTSTLKYAASKAKQKPSEYEAAEGGKVTDVLEMSFLEEPFEQAGLAVTGETLTSEESLEANAFA